MDRDCNSCIHHTEKGCSAWSCKYVSMDMAIRAVELLEYLKAEVIETRLGKAYPNIMIDSNKFVGLIDKALGEVGESE